MIGTVQEWLSNPIVLRLIWLIASLVWSLLFLLVTVLILIWGERKVLGFVQDRYGPHHTGKWGSLQSIADATKLLTKEDYIPPHADKVVFLLAPIAFFAPVIGAFVVLPFSDIFVGADLSVGLVYPLALGSLGVVAIIAAGWSSNNKYSLLGSFRAAAQMISYEIPMVLSLVAVLLVTNSFSLQSIVRQQESVWFVVVLPFAFLTFFICGLAETNRAPFDFPETESELVAGFMTEYSGMRWGMFFLGEYGNMIIISAIASALFLGGWMGPVLPGLFWFIAKVYAMLFLFLWIRATLPRIRVDQLTEFAWKWLIPATLLNIAVVAVLALVFPTIYLAPVAVLNWAMAFGFVILLTQHMRRQNEKARRRAAVWRLPGTAEAPRGEVVVAAGEGALARRS